jgi:hypothetical protein
MTVTIQRDALHQAIDKLPENALIELTRFVEFLQFKVQQDEQSIDQWELAEVNRLEEQAKIEEQPFNPDYFPEGILQGFDFSPEYIAKARKELWIGFGEAFE